MRNIPRYRIDAWSPYAFADDENGRFCEYRYYQELLSIISWKSIDTAPLDRPLLLYCPALNSQLVGMWSVDHWKICLTGSGVKPTHWSELPENPI